MRHRVAGYKLNRDTEHRQALYRNLTAALIQHGRIVTTLAKAKAVRPFVEKLMTLARRGDLSAIRRAKALLGNRFLVQTVSGDQDGPDVERNRRGKVTKAPRLLSKLFKEIGPRYTDRPGGCTRMLRLSGHRLHKSAAYDVGRSSWRVGDGGSLVVLELVGQEGEGGPRVRGRYSRRRQQANQRTAYAAKIRKASKGEAGEGSVQAATEAATPAQDNLPAAGVADKG